MAARAMRREDVDLSILRPRRHGSASGFIFLEIVLGVDNLVFASSPSPPTAFHRRSSISAASWAWLARWLCILFLCFASYLVHMTASLFTVNPAPTATFLGARHRHACRRRLPHLQGHRELSTCSPSPRSRPVTSEEHKARHLIGLPQAVGTIMVMDLVFSIDGHHGRGPG